MWFPTLIAVFALNSTPTPTPMPSVPPFPIVKGCTSTGFTIMIDGKAYEHFTCINKVMVLTPNGNPNPKNDMCILVEMTEDARLYDCASGRLIFDRGDPGTEI